jgi:hypothetical protein
MVSMAKVEGDSPQGVHCFCDAIYYLRFTGVALTSFLLDNADSISIRDEGYATWKCPFEGCRASGEVMLTSGFTFLTSTGAPEHVCKKVLKHREELVRSTKDRLKKWLTS